MRPSVSVVVCTHTDRRLELLVECVDSLTANSRPPHEVVVVVDSNPDLHARLPARLPSAVTVLASRGSGVSEARNTGIAAATGDLVAFIDDDAVADPDWLDHLTAPFGDPAIVATGGRAVPRWERPNRILPPELYWVVGCTYAGHPTSRPAAVAPDRLHHGRPPRRHPRGRRLPARLRPERSPAEEPLQRGDRGLAAAARDARRPQHLVRTRCRRPPLRPGRPHHLDVPVAALLRRGRVQGRRPAALRDGRDGLRPRVRAAHPAAGHRPVRRTRARPRAGRRAAGGPSRRPVGSSRPPPGTPAGC